MIFNDLCMNCFQVKGDYAVCPHCGYTEGMLQKQAYHLKQGTILYGRYIIGAVVGFGGFGVTYKAYDAQLSVLVAIKEFFPNGLINRVPGETKVVIFSGEKEEHFNKSYERFLAEAKHMAKFNNDPHIVNVFDFFEENNTAYMVMEFLEGISLKEFIAEHGNSIDVDAALQIIKPIMDAVESIHAQGIIHRDISPDNIRITVDNKIKLLDFGAARFSNDEGCEDNQKEDDDENVLAAIIKVGYAAPEQYRSKSKQDNYTDIYALGATIYHLLTGIKPDESVDREVEDTLKRPSELGLDIVGNLEKSIMKAMALKPELRFQNMTEFKNAIYNNYTVDYPEVELKKRKRRRAWTAFFLGTAVFVLCGMIFTYFYIDQSQSRLDAVALKADTITVWLPVSGTEADQRAQKDLYKDLTKKFMLDNSKFKVQLSFVPESQYTDKLAAKIPVYEQGESNERIPTLFRADKTSFIPESVSLEKLLRSLEMNNYVFLDRYEEYYPDLNKMPLSFLPVVCYMNQIVAQVLNNPTDRDVLQLIAPNKGKYSFYLGHYRYADLMYLAEPELFENGRITIPQASAVALTDIKHAYNNQGYNFSKSAMDMFAQDTLLYLIEDISLYRTVQKELPGYYAVKPFEFNHQMVASFTNEWSISAEATKNQQEIAMLFLGYLLSDSAQNQLNIQNDNGVPLNKNTLDSFVKVNNEFSFLTEDLTKFQLVGENKSQLTDLNEYVVNNIILKKVDDQAIVTLLNAYSNSSPGSL